MKKLLFLDFDGVLSSHSGLIKRGFKTNLFTGYDRSSLFEEHIECLNWLVKEVPDLQIIISSSWRCHNTLSDIQDMLTKVGFKFSKTHIKDTTDTTDNSIDRGTKILNYINNLKNKEKEEDITYVILDDMPIKNHPNALVHIDQRYGLSYYNVCVCRSILLFPDKGMPSIFL